MSIRIINKENYCILEVNKEQLDMGAITELSKALNDLLDKHTESIIVQLKEVTMISTDACHELSSLHNDVYERSSSIAFAEPQDLVHKKLKQEQVHLIINICPTFVEAVDIISMESLERELMKED